MPECSQLTDVTPGGYGKNNFYSEITTADDWVRVQFVNQFGENFVSGGIQIVCDGVNQIVYSFNGQTVHGELRSGEAQSLDGIYRQCIYFKSLVSGNAGILRLFVW